MAIDLNTPQSGGASAIDIEAWTVEQAAHALAATTISSASAVAPIESTVRGTSIAIDIPLDEAKPAPTAPAPDKRERVHTVYRRRSSIQRDSLRRREALLKGKEGSRRRQRWENDRLLSNPYAQPPLPQDWEVRPTYPVHSVPYFLAPLWDAELKATTAAKAKQDGAKRQLGKTQDPRTQGSAQDQAAARVPAEIKAKLKKSRGARGLLMDLEEEVRQFVEGLVARQQGGFEEAEDDDDDEHAIESSEDEEIVFVGRDGAMRDGRSRRKEKRDSEATREKLVFHSLVEDHGAAFGRWLVHSIATYYGLETWSVTTGNPARREAYVGLKDAPKMPTRVEMPRPLWGLV